MKPEQMLLGNNQDKISKKALELEKINRKIEKTGDSVMRKEMIPMAEALNKQLEILEEQSGLSPEEIMKNYETLLERMANERIKDLIKEFSPEVQNKIWEDIRKGGTQILLRFVRELSPQNLAVATSLALMVLIGAGITMPTIGSTNDDADMAMIGGEETVNKLLRKEKKKKEYYAQAEKDLQLAIDKAKYEQVKAAERNQRLMEEITTLESLIKKNDERMLGLRKEIPILMGKIELETKNLEKLQDDIYKLNQHRSQEIERMVKKIKENFKYDSDILALQGAIKKLEEIVKELAGINQSIKL